MKDYYKINRDRATSFTDIIFDTLMGNKQYPQLNLDKVNDNWCAAKDHEILILYGKTAYKIKIEKLPGLHNDLSTI